MITLQNISKTFNPNTAQEVKALQEINLAIQEGEFLVVIGANGSGKSSLLNAIAGSFQVDKGKILFDHQEVNHLKDYQRSPWVARIFQNPLSGTAPQLTILDNFRIAALRTRRKTLQLGTTKNFEKEVQEKIAILDMGLENKLQQPMGTLSGGQRQALTLVMAIMDKANIILLDEPTAALDPKSAQNLMQNVEKIVQQFELTALLVTHQLKDAQQYGSRIVQMQEGKVLRDITKKPSQPLSSETLMSWFLA